MEICFVRNGIAGPLPVHRNPIPDGPCGYKLFRLPPDEAKGYFPERLLCPHALAYYRTARYLHPRRFKPPVRVNPKGANLRRVKCNLQRSSVSVKKKIARSTGRAERAYTAPESRPIPLSTLNIPTGRRKSKTPGWLVPRGLVRQGESTKFVP